MKNVHEEFNRLALLGIIFFEEDGQRKRLIICFDELVINLLFDAETDDAATAAP